VQYDNLLPSARRQLFESARQIQLFRSEEFQVKAAYLAESSCLTENE
jgi:hypothetical protein